MISLSDRHAAIVPTLTYNLFIVTTTITSKKDTQSLLHINRAKNTVEVVTASEKGMTTDSRSQKNIYQVRLVHSRLAVKLRHESAVAVVVIVGIVLVWRE